VKQRNITGVYKYNPETGEVEKVSDRIPSLKPSVYFPSASDHSGHYSEACDTHFRDKNHKREVLKQKGWAEA
jgi:hypothetical protein